MNVAASYLDTSALLKAYINEATSEDFIAWMLGETEPSISPLSIIELRCAINRRARAGLIDKRRKASMLADFDAELAAGHYRLLSWPISVFETGVELLDHAGSVSLRALDALHLAVARHHRCEHFATADRVQAAAAKKLGFAVHTIFDPA